MKVKVCKRDNFWWTLWGTYAQQSLTWEDAMNRALYWITTYVSLRKELCH